MPVLPELAVLAERAGRVVRVSADTATSPETVLDISGEVDTAGERGLLGLTFSPDGSLLYLHWNDSDGTTILKVTGLLSLVRSTSSIPTVTYE